MHLSHLRLIQTLVTCKWTHWIDSRGYTEPDIGSFEPAAKSTDSVETGSMLHPDTNTMTPYEEVWRTLSASFTDKFSFAWVLRSEDGLTFLGRLGGDFIALKGGNEGPGGMTGFCARREFWDDGKAAWVTKYDAGDAQNLPGLPRIADIPPVGSGAEINWEKGGKAGDSVDAFGGKYIVCAIEKLS